MVIYSRLFNARNNIAFMDKGLSVINIRKAITGVMSSIRLFIFIIVLFLPIGIGCR